MKPFISYHGNASVKFTNFAKPFRQERPHGSGENVQNKCTLHLLVMVQFKNCRVNESLDEVNGRRIKYSKTLPTISVCYVARQHATTYKKTKETKKKEKP